MNKNRNTKNQRPRGRKRPQSKRDEYSSDEKFETKDLKDDLKKKKFGSGTAKVDANFNDVSWYSQNTQMLNDSASFSYNSPLGTKYGADKIWRPTMYAGTINPPVDFELSASSSSVPGVITMDIALTPGLSKDHNSPINLAAQNIYYYVRYNNSGAANYEPVDLMLYMFALDSIYSCWNFYKRAYGLLRVYDQTNWYLPRKLLEGQGFDVDDLMNNISDFRLFLNTMAAKITSFCVPAVMPIFVRHSWMFSNIWADSANQKAQMYQFVPLYFYQYSETGSETGGSLAPVQWMEWKTDPDGILNHEVPVTSRKFSDCQAYLQNLINAVMLSEDIGNMSGDILKAYGQEKLFKLSPVDPDYVVNPVYEEEVLNQIHNATIVVGMSQGTQVANYTISQNPNNGMLSFSPSIPDNIIFNSPSKEGTILNMPWSNVTPANTMVGSRLACTYLAQRSNTQTVLTITACGTEIVHAAHIGFNNYTSNNFAKWYSFRTAHANSYPMNLSSTATVAELQNQLNYAWRIQLQSLAVATLLSNFDWAPMSFMISISEQTKDGDTNPTVETRISGVLADMANYTVISDTDLEQMHLTAIMSEFNIPQIGSF
nr:capsid protein [Rat picobirnavirus]